MPIFQSIHESHSLRFARLDKNAGTVDKPRICANYSLTEYILYKSLGKYTKDRFGKSTLTFVCLSAYLLLRRNRQFFRFL